MSPSESRKGISVLTMWNWTLLTGLIMSTVSMEVAFLASAMWSYMCLFMELYGYQAALPNRWQGPYGRQARGSRSIA
jgi:hypothetical protein